MRYFALCVAAFCLCFLLPSLGNPSPQPVTYTLSWSGESPCADGLTEWSVPRVPWEVGAILVEIEQRGVFRVASVGTLYGLPVANGGCEPGVNLVTRWRVTQSGLGVGIRIGAPFSSSPTGCPPFTPAVVASQADAFLWGWCHRQPLPWLAVVHDLPATLVSGQTRSMQPEGWEGATWITDQAPREELEGSGLATIHVAQAFTYGVEWIGCSHPYSIRRTHQFTLRVTLIPE